MTKTCSKCSESKSIFEFVKSDRYRDGYYPSCKSCRKEVRERSLAENPTCSRCNNAPHVRGNPYCYECDRIMKGRSIVPSHHRDPLNTDKCSRCKTNPRARGKNYCYECARQVQSDWRKQRGGWWSSLTPEQKRKATVRRFIGLKIERGSINREPCFVCGEQKTEIHHLDYEDRTLNILHLCKFHHGEIERQKRNGLTDCESVDYVSLLHKSQHPMP